LSIFSQIFLANHAALIQFSSEYIGYIFPVLYHQLSSSVDTNSGCQKINFHLSNLGFHIIIYHLSVFISLSAKVEFKNCINDLFQDISSKAISTNCFHLGVLIKFLETIFHLTS